MCCCSTAGSKTFCFSLTATPKDEIDKNTYEIFELESGVPTYGFELAQIPWLFQMAKTHKSAD